MRVLYIYNALEGMVINMMGYYGYYNGFNFFGPFLMLAIWVLIAWGIIVFIRMLVGHEPRSHKEDRAIQVLRERFAKGEITKEQFEEALKLLGN